MVHCSWLMLAADWIQLWRCFSSCSYHGVPANAPAYVRSSSYLIFPSSHHKLRGNFVDCTSSGSHPQRPASFHQPLCLPDELFEFRQPLLLASIAPWHARCPPSLGWSLLLLSPFHCELSRVVVRRRRCLVTFAVSGLQLAARRQATSHIHSRTITVTVTYQT